jgi:phosphoribosylformylglycinamidine cyclo-ligase
VFVWLMQEGAIAPAEMARTFNCGIGMVLLVSPDKIQNIKQILSDHGETAIAIGRVVEAGGPPRTILRHAETQWPG